MKLTETVSLTPQQKAAVMKLLVAAHQTDHTFRDPYLSNQFNHFPAMPTFLLVHENELLVGFTMLYADRTTDEPAELYLDVLPSSRRQGVAQLMLERASQILSSYGYHEFHYVSEVSFLRQNPDFLAKTHLKISESEYQMRAITVPQEKPVPDANSNLVVREMKHTDIPALIALQSEAFSVPPAESKTYVEESFADSATLTFVLENQQQIIGYCAIDNGQDYYFFGLVIAKKHRGHGYGTFFVQTIMQLLNQQQSKDFVLGVDKDNPAAIHVYQKNGFEIETEIVLLEKEQD